MPRVKREEVHVSIREDIKNAARQLMSEDGTAGVSLRAIARRLNITAPAIYTYFPSQDDLITALILDGFNGLAEAMEHARDATLDDDPVQKLFAACIAYREWAVTHPTDFQLIYGNPIPYYVAPREVTVPAVVRGFVVLVGLMEQVLQHHPSAPKAPYDQIPPDVEATLRELIASDGFPISIAAMYLGILLWVSGHGAIMLEILGHLPPTVGNSEQLYRQNVVNLLTSMGIPI